MLVAGVWGNKCSQISQTRKTEDMKLEIPVHVAKRWLMHSVHSSEFAKWMEDTGLQVVEVPSPDKKREKDALPEESPAAKKLAATIDPKYFVDQGAITPALLCECKVVHGLQKNDKCSLQLRVKAKYLVNLGTADLHFKKHSCVGSFGKGSFKLLKTEEAKDDAHIQFQLKSPEDLVVLNSSVMTLGQVVSEERTKKPGANVMYHTLTVDESDPSKFTLSVTHRVVFVPSADSYAATESSINQTNICKKAPPAEWDTHCMCVIWQTRWNAKGLQAVAPRVYTKVDMPIKAGQACQLNDADSSQ